MKKNNHKKYTMIIAAILILLIAVVVVFNYHNNQSSNTSTQQETSIQSASSNNSMTSNPSASTGSHQVPTKDDLNANTLTAQQNAALVLYYNAMHLPGSDANDYTHNMANPGQSATCTIYNRDNVPHGQGPLYTQSWPDNAQVLYVVKLHHKSSGSTSIDSTFYTIVGNQVYMSNGDGDFTHTGVAKAEMVAYAKNHNAVARINNVANHLTIEDQR